MLTSEEIITLNAVVSIVNPKGITRSLLCGHKDLYDKIKNIQQNMKLKNFSECIFWLLNNINSQPICPTCNKRKIKFVGLKQGYKEDCGSCSRQRNLEKTMMKNHGVKNAAHIPGIQEKKKQDYFDKHGIYHHFQNPEKIEERRLTYQKTLGVDAPLQAQICKDKVKQTSNDRYGRDHPTQHQSVQDKKKKTVQDKYGVDNVMLIPEVVDRWTTSYYSNSGFFDYVVKLVKSNGYTLVGEYSASHDNIRLKCDKCEYEFEIMWNSFQQHSAVCPGCYPKHHGFSKQEKDILDYIKTFESDVIENSRQIINPYELDIIEESNKIAIEYCGLYFHSSGPNSHDNKSKDYHLKKLNMCIDKGYRLITIFEDEWVLKGNLVKSKLKQIFGKFDGHRIYARECTIKEISYDEKTKFLNQYHLQGTSISTINIGLFFDDKLVSVMTFTSKSNDEYEMSRFCCKENTQVIGGASKLLSYFKKNYTWSSIITYADKRWSDSSFYITLGFTLEKETDPNYWYWGRGIIGRKHRLNYSKSRLEKMKSYDQNLTEFQIMALEKYCWIYDCGNYKFVMTK